MNKVYWEHFDLYENNPWRIYIMEDFSETASYVFLQFHHAFIDGVSLISALKLISDNPDTSTIPPIRGAITAGKKIIGHIFSPCLVTS